MLFFKSEIFQKFRVKFIISRDSVAKPADLGENFQNKMKIDSIGFDGSF